MDIRLLTISATRYRRRSRSLLARPRFCGRRQNGLTSFSSGRRFILGSAVAIRFHRQTRIL